MIHFCARLYATIYKDIVYHIEKVGKKSETKF